MTTLAGKLTDILQLISIPPMSLMPFAGVLVGMAELVVVAIVITEVIASIAFILSLCLFSSHGL